MTLPTRLSRTAVALVAAALAFGGAAQAQGWQPSDDDALLLELRSGKYRLGDTLRGYQTPAGVCVDFGDVIQALDLPVRLDKKSRRATGWIFAESEQFLLDRDSSRVQNVNGTAPLAPGELHDTPEGWCVDTKAMSRWFGVTFRADLSNLNLVIESDRPLPFLQAIERKSRAARLRPADAGFDLASLRRAELPYKTWRTPSVDVLVRAAWRGGGKRDSATDLQYEAYASGELLGASFDARLASDSHAMPATLRLKAYRIDAEAGLLGPLHATQVAAGDVETFAGALTGQSAVGRGVFISNRPVTRPARFGMTTVRGEMPAGWDAELYRNGQLMAYQGDRSDGRYQFDDVALMFGDNLLEVVLYGPQGQIRRERSNVPVGTDAIPAGQTWYWAGIVEQGRDLIDFRSNFTDPLTGWRWGVGVERGIDKRTTVGAEAQSLMIEGRRHNYIEGTLRRVVSPMLLELSAAQELGSGRALRAQAIGRFGKIHVQAETLWIDGGYESELVSPNDRRLYGLRLDSQLKLGNWRLPVGVGVRRREARDGSMVTEWLTRASMLTHGVSLTAELTYKDTAGVRFTPPDDGLALRLLTNAGIGPVRLRGDARFRLSGPVRGFEAIEIMGETNIDHRSHLRVTGEYDGIGKRAQLGVGYVRQFDRFALRGEGTVATDGSVGFGASLAFSLGPDPVDGGFRVSGKKLAQYGQAAVTVFRDENGDGRRGPGEEPVEGIAVEAGMGNAGPKTGVHGRTVIDGLRPHVPVMISIDEGSVADPLLRPKEKGVVVIPRPGVAAAIELALSPTGEAEGTLLGADGEVRGGITLELLDGRGAVVRSVASEYDGYFLFDAIPYGDYRLRVAAKNAELLGIAPELGVAVRIGRANDVARLGQVRLPVGTRGRVAAASE